MGAVESHSAVLVIRLVEETVGRRFKWAGALPDVSVLYGDECIWACNERGGVMAASWWGWWKR